MDNIILFIFLALLAEILGTIGGFGSSVFFVPIASLFLDFQSVLGITAIFHVSSNITKIVFFKHGFDKGLILKVGIPALVFVVIGAYFSKYIDVKKLEIGLAIFLIVTSLAFLLIKNLSLKPTTVNSLLGGTFSGLMAGLIGTGGSIRGITLAAFNLKTEVFIATSAIIDLGVDSSRAVMYYINGFVHFHDFYLLPFLIIASILGTYIGKRILAKVSQQTFKNMVLVLLLITGIFSISRAVFF
jgi:uncharacterized membrane protein YfcA